VGGEGANREKTTEQLISRGNGAITTMAAICWNFSDTAASGSFISKGNYQNSPLESVNY
jgi:hypothetical protein